jgi:tetratricopeptide (TPR) repeat protein
MTNTIVRTTKVFGLPKHFVVLSMKNCFRLLLILIICSVISFPARAQSDANDLIKQGIALHNQGKYTEAIDKFNEVLKTDPENAYANYEMAFSLYAAKKPKDAIPHIDKAVKSSNTSLSVAAYSLLATIYDEGNQSQKAIETYNTAIKINPDYPQIYYNLAVAYSRNQQYAEAETSVIEAIKHNPKHANSQRLYALVTFHQNKRVNALLGFCSFLLLGPNGPLSAEAYGNIQHIIQGGVLKDDKGKSAIPVSAQDEKETGTLNLGISMVVLSGQSKKLSGTDLLAYQLKGIFTLAGQLSEKKTDKTFFDKFFAEYFYKLAQSNHMPTFARMVASSANKDEAAKWMKDNTPQWNAMNDWLKNTERGF